MGTTRSLRSLADTERGTATIGDPRVEPASFTPGPWLAEKSDCARAVYYITHPASDGWSCIAASWAQNEHATQANANLIASAPALYAALEKAPRPGTALDPVEYIDWFFQVRTAALKLARGEK
jgi:hypothetical protein